MEPTLAEKKRIILPIFADERLEPPERLNEARLHMIFKDAKGQMLDLLTMSSDELVLMAAEAEEIRKSLPTHDIAWSRFVNEESQLLKLAELLEKRQAYFHKLV